MIRDVCLYDGGILWAHVQYVCLKHSFEGFSDKHINRLTAIIIPCTLRLHIRG